MATQRKKYMSKKDATALFKALHTKRLSFYANDKAMIRQLWNDWIDGEIKAGNLPSRAGDWLNPFLSESDR